MTFHSRHLTSAAAALLRAGATFHVKSEDDPLKTLTKAFGEHNVEVLKRLGATDQTMKELAARLTDVEQRSVRGDYGGVAPIETWGQQVEKSDAIRGLNSNWKGRTRIEVKATITSATTDALGSAGDLLVPTRPDGIIPLPRRKLRLRQLFAPGRTNSNAVEWPKMTGRDNNAATQAAEGDLKPQSDIKFDLMTWPVRTIAHWMLASKQILDDVPVLASIIDSELRFGLADVEDQQLLNGGGTGGDLTGVYTTATAYSAPFVPSDAGNLNKLDVLLLAIAQVEAADYEADGIVLNALDWRDIQLTKDAEGRYIGDGPFAALAERLWQMPVVTTKAMTAGKFMVGAHREGAQIFDRQDATVEISAEDSDNFRRNLITLRGEERLAFVIKHPDAFVKGDFAEALAAS